MDLPAPLPEPAVRRTLLLYAVLAGLCPLIPIPFVDDAVQGVVVRRMIRQVLAHHGLTAPRGQVLQLTRDRAGCGTGCLSKILLYPVKKLIKTVLFFLAFKTCADVASRWLHRGYLVDAAVRMGALDAAALATPQGTWPASLAIEEVVLETDTSPVKGLLSRAFTGSKRLMRAAAARLWRVVQPRRQPEEAAEAALAAAEAEEEAMLGGILGPLGADLWSREDYFRALQEKLRARLEETRARIARDPPPE